MNALDRLSLRMGIEPEFRDAIGQVRRTDADVSRGLLTAMGLTVTDAREAEAAIRELERADAGGAGRHRSNPVVGRGRKRWSANGYGVLRCAGAGVVKQARIG